MPRSLNRYEKCPLGERQPTGLICGLCRFNCRMDYISVGPESLWEVVCSVFDFGCVLVSKEVALGVE